ncbi:MAG: hypothetical protein ACP5PP_07515 [Fervidobacterium sp.]
MKKMVFILLLLSFSLSISIKTFSYPSNFLSTERLENIIKDVSLLTLGSLGNLSLVVEVGRYVGAYVKNKGYTYYLIGPLDSLSEDDDDYFYRVNKSPFITADIYEKLAIGISAAGVVPVFDGRGKIDTYIVSSIITRKITYPVLVDSQDKINLLRNLGYKSVFILESQGEYRFFDGKYTPLYWKIKIPDGESLRKDVLLNSIIYLGPGSIQVKIPFVKTGVVVFSDDTFVIEQAKKILEKKSGPGRVPW